MIWETVEKARNEYEKACAVERIATEVQACNPCPTNDDRVLYARHDRGIAYRLYVEAFDEARKSGVRHPEDKS